MFLEKGDKVIGIFSQKYLGQVVSTGKDSAIIRAPDGSVIEMSKMMLSRVSNFVDNEIARVWVV